MAPFALFGGSGLPYLGLPYLGLPGWGWTWCLVLVMEAVVLGWGDDLI